MIKNKTIQLMYYTVYCTLGIVGMFACLGIFDDITTIRWDFYVHFTNISNFYCIGVMFLALIQTLKKKEDDFVKVKPIVKFIGVLAILLTFLVFNFMLAGAPDRAPQANWRIGSILFHVVLPILYVLDWFLFYERGNTKWTFPVYSISFPFFYLLFIFIQGVILKFDTSILIPTTTTPLVYPYFFLNVDNLGIMGVLKWNVIFLLAFVLVAIIFVAIDKALSKNKK